MCRILSVRKRRFSHFRPAVRHSFPIRGLLKKKTSSSVLNNYLHNSADQPVIVWWYPNNQNPSQISKNRRDTIVALMNENEQHFGVKRGSNLSVVERLMMIFSPNADVCWSKRGMASRHKLLKSKRPWWTLPLASGLPDAQQSHWTPTIFVMYC